MKLTETRAVELHRSNFERIAAASMAVLLACGTAYASDEPAPVATTSGEATSAASEPAKAEAPDRDIHLSLGVDYTNAYYFRGIVQEDHAFILQPYATLTLDLWEHEDFTLNATAGTWNSFHDSPTNAQHTDTFVENWYEADFILGLGLTIDKLTLGAQYIWYTSPSDSFQTVTELDLFASYDDSELLGAWKLLPSVLVAFETGDDFADGADTQQGVYFQVGINPGFSVKLCEHADLAINFPVTLGLSLDDYYEDASGDDDAFGFLSAGVKASMPLPIPESYGSWSISASLTALLLGNHTADYNDDREANFVATVGISASF